MTHDQLSNPQRTVVEALKQAGFSVSDTQSLLHAVRAPVEQAVAARRREQIATAALATMKFEPFDNTRLGYEGAVARVARDAVAIADALIARLDK
ncbi:hypothetical protein [Burkholderia cenocepacia]|uniref:hypothetical protein n=1 Tax=Burkholderia cenocepacia TaxID=95486 RepID=UPI000D0C5E74|nr:hypothetical protein [Burkholderia cenocepacia]SOT39809.1 hypothetical protein F01_230153 [Burkholderia cenocepacia]